MSEAQNASEEPPLPGEPGWVVWQLLNPYLTDPVEFEPPPSRRSTVRGGRLAPRP